MSDEQRAILPVSQPESDYYWDQAASGKLVVQKCTDCSEAQFYPRVLCTSCGSKNLEWIESTGRGTLFTFAIVHQPPAKEFVDQVPYVAAIVELEEGVKMPSQVIGIEPTPEALRIGMPLEVVFEKLTADVSLPKFNPTE